MRDAFRYFYTPMMRDFLCLWCKRTLIRFTNIQLFFYAERLFHSNGNAFRPFTTYPYKSNMENLAAKTGANKNNVPEYPIFWNGPA